MSLIIKRIISMPDYLSGKWFFIQMKMLLFPGLKRFVVQKRSLYGFFLFCCLLAPTLLFAENTVPLKVFVSIPPQKWLCEQLGGDLLNVGVLIGKGQEPHGFEPSPRQIQSLAGATLYFTVGMEFEHEIVRRLQTASPDLLIVNSSEKIRKIPIEEGGHNHQSILDPHVWLSPKNLKSMAATMVSALSAEDPENAKVYEKNRHVLSDILDRLDQDIAARLAPFRGASFFVFHPAFGYFAHAYGMHQVAVETGGKSPTPRQLFQLIQKARAEKIKVIFVQPQFDPRSCKSVAAAIGGRVVPLDALSENVAENLQIMAGKIEQALISQEDR